MFHLWETKCECQFYVPHNYPNFSIADLPTNALPMKRRMPLWCMYFKIIDIHNHWLEFWRLVAYHMPNNQDKIKIQHLSKLHNLVSACYHHVTFNLHEPKEVWHSGVHRGSIPVRLNFIQSHKGNSMLTVINKW